MPTLNQALVGKWESNKIKLPKGTEVTNATECNPIDDPALQRPEDALKLAYQSNGVRELVWVTRSALAEALKV